MNINPKKIDQNFQNIANERDFYGFLAAENQNKKYELNHQPISLKSPKTKNNSLKKGTLRALEFFNRKETNKKN